MKTMKKRTIRGTNLSKQIKRERILLQSLRHPFIVKFYNSFQDKQKLYLLFEYAQGGDLFTYMTKNPRLPENHAQFYLAEII